MSSAKSSASPPRPSATSRKKSIESSSPTPLNFVYMCAMFVFKRFVFAHTHIKIGVYVGALLLCSLMKDFNMSDQKFYLAHKKNFFNVYFVKLGWAWTLAVCTPFVVMTSVVYTAGSQQLIKKHLARLIVATFAWFVCTSVFEIIDANTGNCVQPTAVTKLDCKTNKHEWVNGLDISGHTFLLMHALFLMLEEAKVFMNWENFRRKLDELAKREPGELASSTSENPHERAEYWFNLLTPFIKINFCFMALLALLWEVMLLGTFLYFHTIMHKLIAAFFAIGAWFLTYRMWYPNKELPLSPGLPGAGAIEKL